MKTGNVTPPYALFDVVVKDARLITPHMKRLTVDAGHIPGLRTDLSAQWMKVFVHNADGERQPGRAYTVRRYDAVTGEIDIDFVLHGDEGRISAWATRATIGSKFELSAPHSKGGFATDDLKTRYIFLADETGLPAVASILEALPRGAKATAVVKVASALEKQAILSPADADIRWIYGYPTAAGVLAEVLDALAVDQSCTIFAAAESGEITAIRTWLKAKEFMGKCRIDISGYWKRGEADHRDST